MISNTIGVAVNGLPCVQGRSHKDQDSCLKIIVKVSTFASLIETAAYGCAIILAAKILTNSLPANLDFLKGRTRLATAMGITGISLLCLSSLRAHVYLPLVMVFSGVESR